MPLAELAVAAQPCPDARPQMIHSHRLAQEEPARYAHLLAALPPAA